jgi:phosphoribosylaminoimidazole-succinocarboxamide synthase
MEKRELIYEGKAKKLYTTDAKKRGTIESKGVVNNRMSEIFFSLLGREGVATHFVKRLSDREMLVKRLDIIPVETVVRNVLAGSLAKRLGREEGADLPHPIVEYYYKSDPLDDPMIIEDHVLAFGFATAEELAVIRATALKVNDVLRRFLDARGILLVDAKFEFGRHKGQVLLGDEICPDTCRFWDKATREKLDKDRFRRDLGNVEEAYREMMARVSGS